MQLLISYSFWAFVYSLPSLQPGNSSDSPPLDNVQLLLNAFGPVSQPVVRMPSATGSGPDVESVLEAGPMLFMLPGLDGLARPLEPLALNLKFQTVCLQLDQDDELLTVEDMADHLLPVRTRLVATWDSNPGVLGTVKTPEGR